MKCRGAVLGGPSVYRVTTWCERGPQKDASAYFSPVSNPEHSYGHLVGNPERRGRRRHPWTMVSVAAITSLLFTGLVWAQPAAAADTCGTAWPAKWPAGGTGSSATPYLIDSQASLAAISDCSGRYFALEKSITLTGAWTPIFGGSSGTAYLDGRGWSISGLSITGSIERAGLFGNLTGGSVSNLTLTNPSLTSTNVIGFLGGFAGFGSASY